MTVYENAKGTRWEVKLAGETITRKPEWRIVRKGRKYRDGLYLMRMWYPTEQSAQTALDELARKKGWKAVES